MRRALSEPELIAFRDNLCAVAERAFIERGADGVTMRYLAERLGCSPMTPYRYFQNKEAILAAVRAAALNRFSERLEAAHRTFGAPARRGRAVGEAYLRFALDEPDAYRLIFDLSQPNESTYPDLMAARGRAEITMSAYMEDLVSSGDFKGDPTTLGLIYWAAVHGLVNLYMAGKIGDEEQLRLLHSQMIRTLSRGARAGPVHSKTTHKPPRPASAAKSRSV